MVTANTAVWRIIWANEIMSWLFTLQTKWSPRQSQANIHFQHTAPFLSFNEFLSGFIENSFHGVFIIQTFYLNLLLNIKSINLFVTSKNDFSNSPILQFKNLKYCIKKSLLKPLLMVYEFLFITLKNHFKPCFFLFLRHYFAAL